MNRIVPLVVAAALLLPCKVIAKIYNLETSHTTISFKVRNFGIMNVNGVFEKFKGIVDIDETDITKSSVDVNIETASISTGISRRDKHLRSSDFFDVAKFPIMSFVSHKVEVDADRKTLKVLGSLTIKGVTKEVVLNVEGPKNLQDDLKLGFSATATVNRQDFGVSWGSIIGDEVHITINAELVRE